jgi:hypothetical protein
MICPKCGFHFFSRKYSARDKPKTVRCVWCDKTFTAPMRADSRRLIREILTDDLFDTEVWRNADSVERVQILVDAVKSTR